MGITTLAFFGGVLLIGVIDRLVPSFEKKRTRTMPYDQRAGEKPKNAKRCAWD